MIIGPNGVISAGPTLQRILPADLAELSNFAIQYEYGEVWA